MDTKICQRFVVVVVIVIEKFLAIALSKVVSLTGHWQIY